MTCHQVRYDTRKSNKQQSPVLVHAATHCSALFSCCAVQCRAVILCCCHSYAVLLLPCRAVPYHAVLCCGKCSCVPLATKSLQGFLNWSNAANYRNKREARPGQTEAIALSLAWTVKGSADCMFAAWHRTSAVMAEHKMLSATCHVVFKRLETACILALLHMAWIGADTTAGDRSVLVTVFILLCKHSSSSRNSSCVNTGRPAARSG